MDLSLGVVMLGEAVKMNHRGLACGGAVDVEGIKKVAGTGRKVHDDMHASSGAVRRVARHSLPNEFSRVQVGTLSDELLASFPKLLCVELVVHLAVMVRLRVQIVGKHVAALHSSDERKGPDAGKHIPDLTVRLETFYQHLSLVVQPRIPIDLAVIELENKIVLLHLCRHIRNPRQDFELRHAQLVFYLPYFVDYSLDVCRLEQNHLCDQVFEGLVLILQVQMCDMPDLLESSRNCDILRQQLSHHLVGP
mmetsp:Transcript_23359/g.75946  ORF Transcript_23359/g.75946 Transcript_23359/m.75946 type:complete len:250 (-) Transcript_23359:799-1548(-)